ncbi:hypothetical protein [Parashewanella tropica]|uniref:hypothetical protein n=1 Tax=Parashewanella tropica TaxID=2547970 RepID=UPI00105965C0|nr:hypothetical protein [Parashewanella tropica]
MTTRVESVQQLDNAYLEQQYYLSIVREGFDQTHDALKLGEASIHITSEMSVAERMAMKDDIFLFRMPYLSTVPEKEGSPNRLGAFFIEDSGDVPIKYDQILERFVCIINHPNVRNNAYHFQEFQRLHPEAQCAELCGLINELPSSVSVIVCPDREDLIAAYIQSLKIKGEETNKFFFCKGMYFKIERQDNQYQVQVLNPGLFSKEEEAQAIKDLSEWLNDEGTEIILRRAKVQHRHTLLIDTSCSITSDGKDVAMSDTFELINMDDYPDLPTDSFEWQTNVTPEHSE